VCRGNGRERLGAKFHFIDCLRALLCHLHRVLCSGLIAARGLYTDDSEPRRHLQMVVTQRRGRSSRAAHVAGLSLCGRNIVHQQCTRGLVAHLHRGCGCTCNILRACLQTRDGLEAWGAPVGLQGLLQAGARSGFLPGRNLGDGDLAERKRFPGRSALAREYPAEAMRIVQEGLDKEDLLQAA